MNIKNSKRLLASLLAVTVAVGSLASCGNKTGTESSGTSTETSSSASTGTDTPLVVAYDPFSEKFSPFFATTAYDVDVATLCSVALLGNDRTGAVVEKGIEGETRPYNGTDYTYTGIADVEIEQGEENTVYTFTIRDDIKFSDGEPLTIDDVIFSYYVYFDPSYYGSTTVGALPIVGLQNYKTQTSDEVYTKYSEIFDAVYAAGEGNTVADVDQAVADQMWQILNDTWKADIQGIVDSVYAGYASSAADVLGDVASNLDSEEGLQVAFGMAMWGFGNVADGVLTGPNTNTTWELTAGT